jgi:hypothetical protein
MVLHLLEMWKVKKILPCVVNKTHGKQDLCHAFFRAHDKEHVCHVFFFHAFFVVRPK